VRETYEDKSTRFRRNEPVGLPGFQAAFPVYESGRLTRHDANTSALLSGSLRFNDSVLGYASVARGAKAGGINPTVPTGGLTTGALYVEPETATDYELGIKTTAFDRRLQFNANLFLADVTDYQATQLNEITKGVFVQVLSNIGKVRSQGVELELQAIPMRGLRVSFNGSYNDAVYRSYANAPCSAERLAAGLRVCDLTGGQVVGAPKWIVSSALDYEHEVSNGLQAFGGINYSWRSSFFGSADNSELARVKAYGILNLRAGVSGDWGTNRWTASVWANNLTDEIYTLGGLSAASATLQYAEFPGTPRAIGATLRLDF
jgi:iron complex outermembrane receptor protein